MTGNGADGWRADLSDVQQRGVATAMDVFDRLIAELDGADRRAVAIEVELDGPDDAPRDFAALRAAVARTFDVYTDLFRQSLELYADVVERMVRSPEPAARPADPAGAEIALAAAPGAEAAATVWIHNQTAEPTDTMALHMTDLTAHDGTRIAASAASFTPSYLQLAPTASRSSTLSVRIPPSAAPGIYVGHVLATGLPETRLSVCLVVAS